MRVSWRAAAVGSLALNLLLLGGLGGLALGGLRIVPAASKAEAGETRRGGGEAFLAALPPEARADLRQSMRRTWREAEPERREIRASRVALMEAVGREPYDRAAVEAAFGRMRAADAAGQARFHEAVARALAQVPVEGRQEALRAAVRMGRGRPGPGEQRPRAPGYERPGGEPPVGEPPVGEPPVGEPPEQPPPP